jgi:hypothetical protein
VLRPVRFEHELGGLEPEWYLEVRRDELGQRTIVERRL